MKMLAIDNVTRLRVVGSPLEMKRGTELTSDPYRWSVSQDRADQMIKDIIVWKPAEPVVAQHRADAVRTVYEHMLSAGCVARAAWRPAQSRMRI